MTMKRSSQLSSEPQVEGIDSTLKPRQKVIGALKELGEVMVAAGFAALIAQAFSFNSQRTALLSLLVVVLAYSWLYRTWINKYINSAAVVIALIAETAVLVYLVVYKPANLPVIEESGLDGFGARANDYVMPQLKQHIEDARQEIWFVGIDFHISAGEQSELILAKLASGVNVHFLFYNVLASQPELGLNPNLQEVADRFAYEKAALISDITSTAEILHSIQSRWKAGPSGGTFDVRVYNEMPWGRAYLFDPKNEVTAYAFIIPYLYASNPEITPALALRGSRSGLLQHYWRSVQAFSRRGQPLETWWPSFEAYKKKRGL